MGTKSIAGPDGYTATISLTDTKKLSISIYDPKQALCWSQETSFPKLELAEKWAEKIMRQQAEDAKTTKPDAIETAVPSVEVVADLPDPVEPVTLEEITAT